MLSTPLYHKDNKGSHYTVGKVRSNISIKINDKEEPRAESTAKSFLHKATALPSFTKAGLLLPHYL